MLTLNSDALLNNSSHLNVPARFCSYIITFVHLFLMKT